MLESNPVPDLEAMGLLSSEAAINLETGSMDIARASEYRVPSNDRLNITIFGSLGVISHPRHSKFLEPWLRNASTKGSARTLAYRSPDSVK